MKKAIVVNPFCFIGFSLTTFLLNEGIEVVGLVMKDKQTEREMEQKLLHIGRNANFTYYHHDDANMHEGVMNADVLYDDIKGETRWDVIGKCKKVIFISYLDMFENLNGDIDESGTPSQNHLFQTEQKRMNQAIEKNISYLIIRIPTLYGPWQEKTHVYQQWIYNQLKSVQNELIVMENTTDILYIDDVTNALYMAGVKNINGEVIHLASGKKNQWFEGLEILTGNNHQLVVKQKVSPSFYKNEKAKKLLDFNPNTTLEQGIKNQIKHTQLLLELP